MSESTNQSFSREVETTASAIQIWAVWTDVDGWGAWDKGLASAMLDGSMKLGAKGTVIDFSGRRLPFTVTEWIDGKAYSFVTALPFGTLNIRRSIVSHNPCRFRHDVKFEGLGGWVLSHFLGPGFRQKLPETMDCIAAIAEGKTA
jgi:hypothetical protein